MSYNNTDYREFLDRHPSRMDIREIEILNFKNSSAESITMKLYPRELKKFQKKYPEYSFELLEQYSGIGHEAKYLIKK